MGRTVARHLMAVTALALLLGCGGGGGGTTTPEARFAGSYHTVIFEALAGATRQAQTLWGTATADGAGLFDIDVTANADGTIVDPPAEDDWPYDLSEGGEMVWDSLVAPGVDHYAGSISRDNRFVALGAVRDGARPSFLMLLRRGSGFDAGSLTGTWNLCAFANNQAAPDTGGNVGYVEFDGAGGWTSWAWWNVDGTWVPGANSAGTYGVNPDGSCWIRFGSGAELSGQIHAGGEFLVAGGGTSGGTWPTAYVLVHRTVGAGLATLSGTYGFAGIEYDPDDDDFISRTGTLVADGAGGFTATVTEDDQGIILADQAAAGTYVVTGDGVMTLTPTGGDVMQGGISGDGTFAVIGGAQGALTAPCLFVCSRR